MRKGGQLRLQVLQLFRATQHRAIVPVVSTYNIAIGCRGKGRQHQNTSHRERATECCAIVPEVIIYEAAVSLCEKGGQPQLQALHILRAMQHRAFVPAVSNCKGAISVRERASSRRPYNSCERCSAVPSCPMALPQCCNQYARKRASRNVLHLLRALRRANVPNVIVYNAAIGSCEKVHQQLQALHLLRVAQCRAIVRTRARARCDRL